MWLTPCGDGREDKILKATCQQRIEMLEHTKGDVLGNDFPNVKICDYEHINGKFLPTYNLLVGLKAKYPDIKFHLCIGADLVEGLETWDDGDKLLEENDFIIMNREGYSYPRNKKPKNSVEIDSHIYGSSTSIRNRIKVSNNHDSTKKFNIYGLTTRSCIEYIIKHNLYH